MYRSIVFLMLTFLLSSGFVNYSNLAKKEAARQQQFLEFLSHFDKVTLPYKLDLASIDCYKNLNRKSIAKRKNSPENNQFYQLTNEFLPSVRGGKFSRMGRPIIQPMARFFPDDQTVAVIYNSRSQYTHQMRNDYMLAYYDLKGNLLGKTKKKRFHMNDQRIGFTNLHYTQVFTIFPSGKIETIFYDNQWKEKVNSIDQEKNELLGFKKVKEINYELAGSRGIQEITQSIARP